MQLNALYSLEYYQAASGQKPVETYLRSLKDKVVIGRIAKGIERLKLGNFGDSRALGEGVYELRLHFGAGHRVYYAKRSDRIILLLCAGNKSTQSRDIERAKLYAQDHQQRTRH